MLVGVLSTGGEVCLTRRMKRRTCPWYQDEEDTAALLCRAVGGSGPSEGRSKRRPYGNARYFRGLKRSSSPVQPALAEAVAASTSYPVGPMRARSPLLAGSSFLPRPAGPLRSFASAPADASSQGAAYAPWEAVPRWTAMRDQVLAMPDTTRKAVGLWMGGLTAWVFSMVCLGGYTRLTRSGLSMTDWKYIEKPPMNDKVRRSH